MSLSPEQRALRASIGGYARAGKHDGREMTAAARAARQKKYLDQVNEQTPGLPLEEQLRRSESLLRADMRRLALRSSKVRAERKAATG
jgi:hypothetical protein